VASPRELNAVLSSGFGGVRILHDGQVKPRPRSSGFVITEALVVRLGEKLHALQSLDGRHIKGLQHGTKTSLDRDHKAMVEGDKEKSSPQES
jgi:hypothetical protein